MPDKLKKDPFEGMNVAAVSLDPRRPDQEALNSLAMEKKDMVLVKMQSQGDYEANEEMVPPLTDNIKSNVQNVAESQISMNINSTFCQEEKEEEQQ